MPSCAGFRPETAGSVRRNGTGQAHTAGGLHRQHGRQAPVGNAA